MSTVHKVLQLWRPGQYIKAYDAGPRLQHLFGAGEQGGVYLFDKAHQGGLFQDAAFTTPVTAVEQYVGSFLDWSGNGNHCAQTTSTARSKWSARVNLITKSEDIEGMRTLGRCTKLSPSSVQCTESSAAGFFVATNFIYLPSSNLIRVKIKKGTRSHACVAAIDSGSLNGVRQFFNTQTGALGSTSTFGSGVSKVSANVDQDGEWWILRFTFSCPNGSYYASVYPSLNADGSFDCTSGDIGHTTEIDVRPAALAYLPYQRVNTATDYDTAGFPHYLDFDGTDDYYASIGNIDFSGTDKMTVVAGYTKGVREHQCSHLLSSLDTVLRAHLGYTQTLRDS